MEQMMTTQILRGEASVAERLSSHFFNDEAKRRPGYRESLGEQARRVLAIAKACDGKKITYGLLNELRADGVILQGFIALGLLQDDSRLVKRWHLRMARYMGAVAAAMEESHATDTTTVGEVLFEQELEQIWMHTA
jgi:hypothetical protein